MPEDIPEGWSYYRLTCRSKPHSFIIKNRRRERKLHHSGCEIKPGIEHDRIASASTLVNTRAKKERSNCQPYERAETQKAKISYIKGILYNWQANPNRQATKT